MIANKMITRSLSLFLSCLIVWTPMAVYAGPGAQFKSVDQYEKEIGQATLDLQRAVADNIKELTLWRRAQARVMNFIPYVKSLEWVPNVLWLKRLVPPREWRPYGQIRQQFYDVFKLLHDLSTDSSIPSETRNKMSEALAKAITVQLDRLTEEYADPSDMKLLDMHQGIDNKVGKFFASVAARLLWVFAAMGRDLSTGLLPISHQYNGQVRLSVPRAMPLLGQDAIRSNLLKRVANDLHRIYTDVKAHPDQYPEAVQALDTINTVSQEVNVEPLEFGHLHKVAMAAYLLAGAWFFFNPAPELVIERTQFSALFSSIAYVGFFGGLIWLRRTTSGTAFLNKFQSLLRTVKASTYQPKTIWQGLKGLFWDSAKSRATATPCTRSFKRLQYSR